MKEKSVKISEIVIDGGTQQREKIDLAVVAEYAESMRCGAKFPPVALFFDGAQYHLADGFHRFYASREAEFMDMLCDVHEGTRRDALLFSAGANTAHGLRLSNADKRRSVMALLNDDEWVKWSDSKIAVHCRVTQQLVSKIRNEVLFGIKKENRATTVVALTQKPAPVADLAFQKSDETGGISEENDADYNPADDELAEAHESIRALSDENSALRDAVATGQLPDAEIEDAASIIAGLRDQVKSLEINLSAVTIARDGYMRENSQMKKQIAMQAKEIKKLKNATAPLSK